MGSCKLPQFCFIRFEAKPDDPVLFDHRANGAFMQVRIGSRRFLRNQSCTFAPVTDLGRTGSASPRRQPSAGPTTGNMKPPTIGDFETQSRGFSTRCLRFTASVTADYARLAGGYSLPEGS